MKIANVKGMVAKAMMAVLAAGAFMVVSPAKAEAQAGFGIEVGRPFYGPPRRDFEFERRQAFLRHEEWVRAHHFYGRGYYR